MSLLKYFVLLESYSRKEFLTYRLRSRVVRVRINETLEQYIIRIEINNLSLIILKKEFIDCL